MDADEKLPVGVVGDLRSSVELDERVGFPRVDDLYPLQILFDEPAELEGDSKCDILFLCFSDADRTRILSPVARIDDDHLQLPSLLRLCQCLFNDLLTLAFEFGLLRLRLCVEGNKKIVGAGIGNDLCMFHVGGDLEGKLNRTRRLKHEDAA